MRILIIDNLFQPNKAGVVANGAQKFTRQQMDMLGTEHETWYITAKGSDKQYNNHFILEEWFDLSLPEKSDKIAQTKRVSKEIHDIIMRLKPDVVLDSSCKHLSGIWDTYPNGSVIFEHYYSPSMPLGVDTRSKFEKKKVWWCGVSQFQNKKFNNYFDDVINLHMVTEYPEDVMPAKDYGIFISRWDGGKSPHVALKKYLKSGSQVPIKCFIKYGGTDINPKELETLQANPLLSFQIDAPRSVIHDAMSEAKFCLAAGHESTGLVSLECAAFGVPYIVCRNGAIAEEEHMPKGSVFVCRTPEDILEAVSKVEIVDRKSLSEEVIHTYDARHFIDEHLRVIKNGKNAFPKGWFE